MKRVLRRYEKIESPIDRYHFISSLQDRNETLFYKVLMSNIKEMGMHTKYFSSALKYSNYYVTSPNYLYAYRRFSMSTVQYILQNTKRNVLFCQR